MVCCYQSVMRLLKIINSIPFWIFVFSFLIFSYNIMPPNTQQQQQALDVQNSFVDHFWSKDKTGMDQLLKYIHTTHDDLDMLHTIYTQR